MTRRELEVMVQAFFAAGGTITVLPPGKAGARRWSVSRVAKLLLPEALGGATAERLYRVFGGYALAEVMPEPEGARFEEVGDGEG